MLRVIYILFFLWIGLVQVSCQKNDKKSVLVIAVDKLAMSDVICNQEQESSAHSGISILCKESVRFTHAYTTSALSTPALTTLLTGLYPYEHKVRHNGGPGLASEFELSSEIAIKKNYRTSFFSGGAPVFRKSGLHQGFELFEDNISPQASSLFRPFNKTALHFLQWLKNEADGYPFFSIIYVPDLSFTTKITTTNLGEMRNQSFESQMDEFNDSLLSLIQNLKSMGRWDDTTVILVGLNGHSSGERIGDFNSANLHGENTQVGLLVKLALNKKRDEAIYWKVDQNISLVDLGRTLFDLLGVTNLDSDNTNFPRHSLLQALKTSVVKWPEDRPILIESGWPLWRNSGPIKTAVILNHVLYINNEKPLLYNTLLDRFEVNPLPLLQESILPLTNRIETQIRRNEFTPYPSPNPEFRKRLSLPYSRWMRKNEEGLLLRDLKVLNKSFPKNTELQNWTAHVALGQNDWETLQSLGKKNKISIWEYVANKNLNLKPPAVSDPCFILLTLNNIEPYQQKKCEDPLFLEFIDWIFADSLGLSKEIQKKKFERSFQFFLIDQMIDKTNIALELNWDTNIEQILAPSRTLLALSLPEFAKTKIQIYNDLAVKNDELQN